MLNLGSNSQFHNRAGIGKPDLVLQYEGKEKIRRIIAILISNKFDSDNNPKKADVVLG